MLRRKLKTTAEILLSAGPAAWLGRRALRGRALVLAYHNVVPDHLGGLGDPSLHLPLGRFRRQLDELLRLTRPIALSDALGEDPDDPGSAPRVAVTFDDAYRGAVTLGVEELTARGIPATVFVAPGLLGDRTLWWDALGARLDGDRGSRIRRHAIEHLGGRQEAVLTWARREGLTVATLPAELRTASEAEVDRALGRPGIRVASHTWSHPSLPHVGVDELNDELARPRRWLRDRTKAVDPWIAYPYGHSSGSVRSGAAAAGYRGGLLVDGGWLPRGASPSFELPRLTVPAGLSTAGFRARLSGTLGDR